ncbi:MAG TPA: MBL fold metallo-hydrolase [Acidimicrobiales bacterium]|nr:MBL fold metallo-hydrolase [Acidimicrobiales bacterium]
MTTHPEIAPGVVEIDTLLGGWERMTAGYLITGDAPVLVETGSQTSVPALLDALAALNVDAGTLAGVVVTHIHLDHAGGVGDVAAAFPAATVYVHERGARHLVDPTKLVNSAAMVYGDLLDSLYGRLTATDATRVRVLADGDEVHVSPNRTLTTVDSPGHAKHHLAVHDSESGLLFAGDAVGVRLPDAGILRPATPPPDFDLDQAIASLRKFRHRRPAGIALAHYGLVPDPEAILEEAEGTLRRWAEVAEAAWRRGEDIAAALDAEFGHGPEIDAVDPEVRDRLDTLNGIHSNAAGFQRWLDTRGTAGGHGDQPHPNYPNGVRVQHDRGHGHTHPHRSRPPGREW